MENFTDPILSGDNFSDIDVFNDQKIASNNLALNDFILAIRTNDSSDVAHDKVTFDKDEAER